VIPRRFYWLFDLIALSTVFLLSYWYMPYFQTLIALSGVLHLRWIEMLSPPLDQAGSLQPLTHMLWILVVSIPPTILTLDAVSRGGRWVEISLSRMLIAGMATPFAGLAIISLAMFALKIPSQSRIFLFLFVLMSGFALTLYRMILRSYINRRLKMGYYAKNAMRAKDGWPSNCYARKQVANFLLKIRPADQPLHSRGDPVGVFLRLSKRLYRALAVDCGKALLQRRTPVQKDPHILLVSQIFHQWGFLQDVP